ncbi:MAG: hypothetical protein WC969_13640 [Elusimicrobiota bacterium]|jgi:hypothetical protein
MTTLKNLLVLLGALFIPLVVMVVGFNGFHAGPAPAYAGYGLLLALAAVFGFKRNFTAMGLYLGSVFVLMIVYPKLAGLESYGREGRMLGQLSELRMHLEELKAAQGAYPATAEALAAKPLDLLDGHSVTSAVESVRLPPEAYLAPPSAPETELLAVVVRAQGSEREYRRFWSREERTPILLYPGGTYAYEVRRGQGVAFIASGTVTVPLPPDFKVDGGAYVYDSATGQVFINCTHDRRQQVEPWWTF